MDGKKVKVRQFYFKLLLVYIMLLLAFFLAFVGVVIYLSYNLDKDAYELEIVRELNEAQDLVDEYIENAEKIFSRVNYSVSFMEPYKKLVSHTPFTPMDTTTIIMELRNAYSWSGIGDIEDILLFTDENDKAYSAAGVVDLSSPFSHMSFPTSYLAVSTISELLSVNSSKFTFSDENLLFVRGFRYQGGRDRGVIVISFNLEKLEKKLGRILSNGSYEVSFNNSKLFGSMVFNRDGLEYEFFSSSLPKLNVKVLFAPFEWSGPGAFSTITLIAGTLLFLVILVLFVISRRKYNKSLTQIRELIPYKERIEDDEISSMIQDLQGMVVDFNTYKENLDQAIPFIETGFFASDASEEQNHKYVNRYMGFVKPYYLVLAVNIDSASMCDIEKSLKRVEETLSEERTIVSHHISDNQTVLIFLNTDSKHNEEDVADNVQKILKDSFAQDVKITIGVDVIRQDFSSFKLSCNNALKALNMMRVIGKDDIYFSDDKSDGEATYYMIPAFYVQIAKCITQHDEKQLQSLFQQLLKTNLMKYDLNADSVKAIADVYLTEKKVYMDLAIEPRYGQIVRPNQYSTIEELIEFYYDRFSRMLSIYGDRNKEENNIYSKVVKYVDENFTDPNLSLKNLGDMFSISTKSIGNYFSQEYGHTYLEYLTHKRITYSMTLLEDESNSIDDVAIKCGYSSSLTFRRNFKESLGQTPSEYRKNLTH